ncbi:hypothetical protein [Vibrio sp. HN007]
MNHYYDYIPELHKKSFYSEPHKEICKPKNSKRNPTGLSLSIVLMIMVLI